MVQLRHSYDRTSCTKNNEEKIDYLEELLKKMDLPELSSDEYSTLNIEFHSVIYAASELTTPSN